MISGNKALFLTDCSLVSQVACFCLNIARLVQTLLHIFTRLTMYFQSDGSNCNSNYRTDSKDPLITRKINIKGQALSEDQSHKIITYLSAVDGKTNIYRIPNL